MRTDDEYESLPAAQSSSPDAHGQAAMLLVESLLHSLLARSVIEHPEALEIVSVAIDARIEIAADLGESDNTTDEPLALLTAIRTSLGTMSPVEHGSPRDR